MSLLYPDLYLPHVTAITTRHLHRLGVRALILDVDNTLATHGNPQPGEGVLDWLRGMSAAGVPMMLLSNNYPRRVKPFAGALGLPFTAIAAKPLPIGFWRAQAKLDVPKHEIAVVGDQLFTDVLGGRLYGAATILIQPIMPEKTWMFKLKRRLERNILKRYYISQREKGSIK